MKTITQILCALLLLAAHTITLAAPTSKADGKTTYQQACAVCHMNGVAAAPKTHDKAAWQQRLDAALIEVKKQQPNLDQAKQQTAALALLIDTVKQGKGVMPAGGMCPKCSDQDYSAAIIFMMAPSKE